MIRNKTKVQMQIPFITDIIIEYRHISSMKDILIQVCLPTLLL